MATIHKILIANRGEIACRVMRTCRAMGIRTVAVYSSADSNALHVKMADEAVFIGAAPASESYLSINKIIAAAKKMQADAIHPGYGFLSENADFAAACAAADIIFIGPAPESMRQMGLKIAGRKIAETAGVPIVPGYNGDDQSDANLRAAILRIGFPVLIKASAGGGGKGMRVVRETSEIAEGIASARREAEKSFGDGSLLLEKFIEQARHVEIQILGDAHGNLVHLFERDCSLQRRHQKIIEASPAPAVDEELREKIGAAAVRLGKALHYQNAGTVEFILAPNGEFYFIEINTRLQVEHPVTEMITGLDIVQLQIEIAEGQPLPFTQNDLRQSGHAIEARIYAEDPHHEFLPATGKILALQWPENIAGVRVDAGISAGDEIGIYYDPLLAKIIAHGNTRQTALRKLRYALASLSIQGVTTNQEFLVVLLAHEDFANGVAHTNTIAANLAALLTRQNDELNFVCAVAATMYWQKKWQQSDALLAEIPASFRNNPVRENALQLQIGNDEHQIFWHQISADKFAVTALEKNIEAEIISFHATEIRLVIDNVQRAFQVYEQGAKLFLHTSLGTRCVQKMPRHPEQNVEVERGALSASMPGRVTKILVSVGQTVQVGEALLILEAMKMEQTMRAAIAGKVTAIFVAQGQIVGPSEALLTVSEN